MKFNKMNCFSVNDQHFLFDGNTGNYFQMSGNSAGVVNKMLSDKDELIFSTIQSLYLQHKFTIPKTKRKITKNLKIKSIAINVASTCNLKCIYCWNNQGSYSQTKQSKIITNDDINAIIGFLNTNAEDLDVRQFELFGGEPLLDKSIIRQLIVKLRNFSPSSLIKITTNGTLIDEELADFFFTQGNMHIVISIDGNEKYHDANRPYPDGSNSYKDALKGLFMIKNRNIRYSVRATLPEGIFVYKDYAESFYNNAIFNFTISKCDNNTSNYFNITDYRGYAKTYQEYLLLLLNLYRKTNILLPDLYMILSKTLCNKIMTMTNRCGAACHILGIDTDGNIYPCEILAGDKTTLLGNIRNTKIKDIRTSAMYKQMKKAKFPECTSCWLAAKCVICYKSNLDYSDNEDLLKVSPSLCKVQKLEMESAIWLTSLLSKPERESVIKMIANQE